ncbi:MAG TPA: hypothetical protein VFP84_27855 [Kofleriaceae bacterium]|nr:hypothetical protein [Kofleriaceae bacterium]
MHDVDQNDAVADEHADVGTTAMASQKGRELVYAMPREPRADDLGLERADGVSANCAAPTCRDARRQPLSRACRRGPVFDPNWLRIGAASQ